MKKRYELLDFLRVLAILLVLNSHLDNLYPISALATGGAAGNGLFFICFYDGECVFVEVISHRKTLTGLQIFTFQRSKLNAGMEHFQIVF